MTKPSLPPAVMRAVTSNRGCELDFCLWCGDAWASAVFLHLLSPLLRSQPMWEPTSALSLWAVQHNHTHWHQHPQGSLGTPAVLGSAQSGFPGPQAVSLEISVVPTAVPGAFSTSCRWGPAVARLFAGAPSQAWYWQ